MTGNRFFRYALRTTAMTGARDFYAGVVGAQFWASDVCVTPLPERAAALGTPAHWLGHVGISDVEGTASRVVALGGQRLGPTQRGADGSLQAVLRDPFGAIVAVSSETIAPGHAPVGWHLHNSQDHERTFALYAALFGWTATDVLDLGPQGGRHQMFAWDESGRSIGSMADLARLPHVHPQWLFFFRVPNIEDALARVRRHGGKELGPTRISTGDIVAPCDDPQGAAFGLFQSMDDVG